MEYSLKAHIKPLIALKPAALNAATAGELIDSQGFESMTFVVSAAAITTALAFKIEHGDASDFSDATVVAATDLVGDMPAFADDEDNSVKWVGYIGKKQYVKLSLVSGDGTLSAVAIMGHPYTVPTA